MRFRLALLMTLMLAVPTQAAERPTDAEINALVKANMEATQAADLDALLSTIHPDSLARPNMARALESLKAYKLRFQAPSARFITMSGEFALVRVVQQTIRVEGPDFFDNEIDGIWALKLDGAKWKYWTQMSLKTRSLAPVSQ